MLAFLDQLLHDAVVSKISLRLIRPYLSSRTAIVDELLQPLAGLIVPFRRWRSSEPGNDNDTWETNELANCDGCFLYIALSD
jgi:hypothetical protein